MDDATEALRSARSDRYALDRQIGEGRMGRVYLAEDLKHCRPVAIKVLRAEFETPEGIERFLLPAVCRRLG